MIGLRLGLGVMLVLLALAGAGRAESPAPRILVIGDSLMSSNRTVGGSVAQALARDLGAEVLDRSMPGARYFFGLPLLNAAGLRISAQMRDGPWDYVVMNGGGNDLLFGCGCGKCTRVLDRLVSVDGSIGEIPLMVAWARSKGAEVIYTGYMRTPGLISPVESCGPLGDELDRRLARMAERDQGVSFVLLADLVQQNGDRSYHGFDLIHPSVKGSAAIAARVEEAMAEH